MRTKPTPLLLLLSTFVAVNVFAQGAPFVYDDENTCADCPEPPFPAYNELPTIRPLTDPFEWSDGSGRSTNFEDWRRRRAEIGAEIQHYEIGKKPARPDSIEASYSNDTLRVNITVNGHTLTLASPVTLPEGDGPFPAVIGMNRGTGAIPSDIFTSRNIATIAYLHNQVVTYGSKNQSDPYYQLYPDLYYTGQYSSWIWGISRLIDGLELVQDDLPIDLKHLAVTGCSYAGKMALFAGAFDERIALTISQESGGGGYTTWRVSETLGNVEKLGSTDYRWFMESLRQFANSVEKLPYDHHELMGMVAPRALLVTGNPDYTWLADPSGYVGSRAVKEVYKAFGVPDRFGFSIVAGHMHCAVPNSQIPEIEAFVDKFLLGDTTANTNIETHPYQTVNYERWIEWWGTGDPSFPDGAVDTSKVESIYFEAECASHGSDWEILTDDGASNGAYATVKSGLNSTGSAPTGSESTINIPFNVSKDTTFYLFARLNCPTPDDDSFWIKFDTGDFMIMNGLGTIGWQWVSLTNIELTAGDHTLTVAYREDGALLDKIGITSYVYGPEELGEEEAINICDPSPATAISSTETIDSYSLRQNYPNPFNPSTEISYSIPKSEFVKITVYDILGKEIQTLKNEFQEAGSYKVQFEAQNLSSGIYLYKLQAGAFTQVRKMLLVR